MTVHATVHAPYPANRVHAPDIRSRRSHHRRSGVHATVHAVHARHRSRVHPPLRGTQRERPTEKGRHRMNPAPPFDCALCARRIGKTASHYLLSGQSVICVRCLDRHDLYDEKSPGAGTRAGIARLLGVWP